MAAALYGLRLRSFTSAPTCENLAGNNWSWRTQSHSSFPVWHSIDYTPQLFSKTILILICFLTSFNRCWLHSWEKLLYLLHLLLKSYCCLIFGQWHYLSLCFIPLCLCIRVVTLKSSFSSVTNKEILLFVFVFLYSNLNLFVCFNFQPEHLQKNWLREFYQVL